MNEFDGTQPRLNAEVVAEMEKHFRLIERWRKIPGLRLWEFDTTTQILKEVEPQAVAKYSEDPLQPLVMRQRMRPRCLYFQALNRKNAVRKIYKILNQIHHERTP